MKFIHYLRCAYVAAGVAFACLGLWAPACMVFAFTVFWLVEGWRPWSPGSIERKV